MRLLAWRSLLARRSTFAATALSIFLGATMILSFLSLLDTALADDVSARDRETLATMAGVVGGWALILVLFSVASTLGLAVRQRAEEFALLRTTGATPRQLRRMVLRETGAVAVFATAVAVLPGWLLGRLVLTLGERGGLVADGIEHRLGLLSLGGTAAVMVVTTIGTSALAVRRALRGAAVSALALSRTGRTTMGRWRIVGGVLCLLAGAGYSMLTVTVMADSSDPYAAMSTAGPASILWSLGLALFAPALLRGTATLAAGVLGRAGTPGFLAVFNARRRSGLLAGVLMPIVVFVGIGTGTLYLMSIENAALSGGTLVDAQTVELLNYVVVGMISVFAAIMIVNTLVAAVADRRREFGLQRLAGSTAGQVTAMLLLEGGLIVLTGIVLGGLASLGTVIPYSIVKTDGWLPGSGPWLYGLVCAAAIAITLGTTRVTAARALRGRAVDAALVG